MLTYAQFVKTIKDSKMGCDIHYSVEVFDDAKTKRWIQTNFRIYSLDNRDYAIFGKLAAIRYETDESIQAKGQPKDISRGAEMEIEEWDIDGHSHTWFDLPELLYILKEYKFNKEIIADLKMRPSTSLSSEEINTLWQYNNSEIHFANWLDTWNNKRYRVIIWFDN